MRVSQAGIAAAGLTSGPLFRTLNRNRQPTARAVSPAYVARLVKRTAAAAGLDPAHYAGHSVRAGLATTALSSDHFEIGAGIRAVGILVISPVASRATPLPVPALNL